MQLKFTPPPLKRGAGVRTMSKKQRSLKRRATQKKSANWEGKENNVCEKSSSDHDRK